MLLRGLSLARVDVIILPAELQAVEDYEQFKKVLKTHLFD